MKVNSRLQIVCMALPAPGWISVFADRLQKKGNAVHLTTSDELLPESLTINLSGINLKYNGRVLTPVIDTSGNRFKKGISRVQIREQSGTTDKLLLEAVFPRFKTENSQNVHLGYLLEKAITLQNVFEADPVTATGTDTTPWWKRYFFRDNWSCALVDAPLHEVAFSKKAIRVEPVLRFDKKILRADPFGFSEDGQEFIIYEKQEQNEKGKIVFLKNGKETITIANDWHMSYPFLFREDEQWYVLPEQQESGRTDLYQLDANTGKLGFYKTLLSSFPATDPTLIRYQGRFWLFCTDSANQGDNTRLHLFFAENLDGEWQPHSQNPVKITARGSRPAGALFLYKNELFRPGQDNSGTYGGAINFYKVTQLSTIVYEEKLVNTLQPRQFGKKYEGIHTISAFGNKTLIDLKQKSFSLRNILKFLRKR